MAVRSGDIRRVLSEGGVVRFIWHKCRAELVTPNGAELRIDGRTYQGFLKRLALQLDRTETGSAETRDLVIEWRSPEEES